MINKLDDETKKRVNKAISNIRLIATRVKRASLLDASQRVDIVVNLLNEFRQYVNINENYVVPLDTYIPFKHNRETLARCTTALFQADAIHSLLTRENKKKYDTEYHQVAILLENIHAYLLKIIEKGGNNATQ